MAAVLTGAIYGGANRIRAERQHQTATDGALRDNPNTAEINRLTSRLTATERFGREVLLRDGSVGRVALDPRLNVCTAEGSSYIALLAHAGHDNRLVRGAEDALREVQIGNGTGLPPWRFHLGTLATLEVRSDFEKNSATDADTDSTLSLIWSYGKGLYREYDGSQTQLRQENQQRLDHLWPAMHFDGRNAVPAPSEDWQAQGGVVLHSPSYFSTFAFEAFARFDSNDSHNWLAVARSTRQLRRWSIMKIGEGRFSPDFVGVVVREGELSLIRSDVGIYRSTFGYDGIRTFVRIGMDARLLKDDVEGRDDSIRLARELLANNGITPNTTSAQLEEIISHGILITPNTGGDPVAEPGLILSALTALAYGASNQLSVNDPDCAGQQQIYNTLKVAFDLHYSSGLLANTPSLPAGIDNPIANNYYFQFMGGLSRALVLGGFESQPEVNLYNNSAVNGLPLSHDIQTLCENSTHQWPFYRGAQVALTLRNLPSLYHDFPGVFREQGPVSLERAVIDVQQRLAAEQSCGNYPPRRENDGSHWYSPFLPHFSGDNSHWWSPYLGPNGATLTDLGVVRQDDRYELASHLLRTGNDLGGVSLVGGSIDRNLRVLAMTTGTENLDTELSVSALDSIHGALASSSISPWQTIETMSRLHQINPHNPMIVIGHAEAQINTYEEAPANLGVNELRPLLADQDAEVATRATLAFSRGQEFIAEKGWQRSLSSGDELIAETCRTRVLESQITIQTLLNRQGLSEFQKARLEHQLGKVAFLRARMGGGDREANILVAIDSLTSAHNRFERMPSASLVDLVNDIRHPSTPDRFQRIRNASLEGLVIDVLRPISYDIQHPTTSQLTLEAHNLSLEIIDCYRSAALLHFSGNNFDVPVWLNTNQARQLLDNHASKEYLQRAFERVGHELQGLTEAPIPNPTFSLQLHNLRLSLFNLLGTENPFLGNSLIPPDNHSDIEAIFELLPLQRNRIIFERIITYIDNGKGLDALEDVLSISRIISSTSSIQSIERNLFTPALLNSMTAAFPLIRAVQLHPENAVARHNADQAITSLLHETENQTSLGAVYLRQVIQRFLASDPDIENRRSFETVVMALNELQEEQSALTYYRDNWNNPIVASRLASLRSYDARVSGLESQLRANSFEGLATARSAAQALAASTREIPLDPELLKQTPGGTIITIAWNVWRQSPAAGAAGRAIIEAANNSQITGSLDSSFAGTTARGMIARINDRELRGYLNRRLGEDPTMRPQFLEALAGMTQHSPADLDPQTKMANIRRAIPFYLQALGVNLNLPEAEQRRAATDASEYSSQNSQIYRELTDAIRELSRLEVESAQRRRH